MTTDRAKILSRYLAEASEEHPKLGGIFSLYSSLIDICYTAVPDDLRPFLKEKPWTPDSVPLLDLAALESAVLVHTAETYRRIQAVLKGESSPEGPPTTVCLKWALKPSLLNLRMEIVDKIPLPIHPACPLCGGDPFMAEILSEDQRFLYCGFCAMRWPFPVEICLSCGNQDREKMGFFVSDDRGRRGYRAETCEICKTYIKTAYRKVQMDYPDDIDIEDVMTLPLDTLACHRGYRKS